MSGSFPTQWTVACQVPLSTGFPRHEYWSGLPFTGDLLTQGLNSHPLHYRADSLPLSHQGRPFECLTLSKHPSIQFLWWKTCSFWRSIQASPPKWICSWSFRPLSCSIVCALIAIAPASFLWNNTYLVVYNCIRLYISIEFLVISHTLFAIISPTPTLSSPPSHLHKAKCMLKSESEVAQSCPTLCDPINWSLPRSSVHGIFQARVLEWVAIYFSRGYSQPRDWTWVSRIVGTLPSEPPGKSNAC